MSAEPKLRRWYEGPWYDNGYTPEPLIDDPRHIPMPYPPSIGRPPRTVK